MIQQVDQEAISKELWELFSDDLQTHNPRLGRLLRTIKHKFQQNNKPNNL